LANGLNFTIVVAFICIIFDTTNCFQDFFALTTRAKLGRPITMLKIMGARNFRLNITSQKTLGSPIFFDQSIRHEIAHRLVPDWASYKVFQMSIIFFQPTIVLKLVPHLRLENHTLGTVPGTTTSTVVLQYYTSRGWP
jgi:hypothetical protein